MFNLKQFFTAPIRRLPGLKPSNVVEHGNGYRFAHVERNKYAPWGRGAKAMDATSGVKVL